MLSTAYKGSILTIVAFPHQSLKLKNIYFFCVMVINKKNWQKNNNVIFGNRKHKAWNYKKCHFVKTAMPCELWVWFIVMSTNLTKTTVVDYRLQDRMCANMSFHSDIYWPGMRNTCILFYSSFHWCEQGSFRKCCHLNGKLLKNKMF